MRANRLRESLKSGQPAVGGWCAIPSPLSAEVVASLGFGYVCIDMQHGMMDFGMTVTMLQAMAVHGPTPLVRVPVGDYATAQRVLDAGAEGIIFPMINTAAEAADAVATCRYAPAGRRSIGPLRSQMHLGKETHNADAQVMCLVMIETVEAIANLDAILSVPGLDGVYVGPSDLGLSLGLEAWVDDPRRDAAIDQVLAACRRHGAVAAIHVPSGAAAGRAIEQGFVMASISSELAVLAEAYKAELAAATTRVATGSPAAAV